MNKKLILLLTAGLMAAQLLGCGNNKQESVEEESAVEISTADSGDNETSSDIVPVNPSQQYDDSEDVYEKAEISCSLPKGFKAYEAEEGMYVHKNYPKDLSTISYVISEGDENITEKSKEEYQTMIEQDFDASYGDTVPVTIEQYDKIRIDVRPGLKIRLQYELKGTVYEQLSYNLFNGDETHILTFTQEEGAGWMDEFEKCGESIHFVATEE